MTRRDLEKPLHGGVMRLHRKRDRALRFTLALLGVGVMVALMSACATPITNPQYDDGGAVRDSLEAQGPDGGSRDATIPDLVPASEGDANAGDGGVSVGDATLDGGCPADAGRDGWAADLHTDGLASDGPGPDGPSGDTQPPPDLVLQDDMEED
jgi:hypothetical protein